MNRLRFHANGYETEVERALSDTSWETPDRTAARLLAGKIDRPTLARHGLSFAWASGRARSGAFSISFRLEPGPYHVLVHHPWAAESPEEIAQQAAQLLRLEPANWVQAEWFPQQAGLGAPLLAGPGWRRGDA